MTSTWEHTEMKLNTESESDQCQSNQFYGKKSQSFKLAAAKAVMKLD